jgi:hypothetical protein
MFVVQVGAYWMAGALVVSVALGRLFHHLDGAGAEAPALVRVDTDRRR